MGWELKSEKPRVVFPRNRIQFTYEGSHGENL